MAHYAVTIRPARCLTTQAESGAPYVVCIQGGEASEVKFLSDRPSAARDFAFTDSSGPDPLTEFDDSVPSSEPLRGSYVNARQVRRSLDQREVMSRPLQHIPVLVNLWTYCIQECRVGGTLKKMDLWE